MEGIQMVIQQTNINIPFSKEVLRIKSPVLATHLVSLSLHAINKYLYKNTISLILYFFYTEVFIIYVIIRLS